MTRALAREFHAESLKLKRTLGHRHYRPRLSSCRFLGIALAQLAHHVGGVSYAVAHHY